MPPAAPIIGAAALSAGGAFATGATFLGLTGVSAALAIGATPCVLGTVIDGKVKS